MRTITTMRSISLSIFTLGLAACATPEEHTGQARQASTVPPNTVLILDGAANGAPYEAMMAASAGFSVEVASAAAWSAKTAAEFADYEAVIIGAMGCSTNASELGAALANSGTWGPMITGNVIVAGTDPGSHVSNGGNLFARDAIRFAASGTGTGAYVSLSCYYAFTPSPTTVPVLAPFGTFTVKQPAVPYLAAHQVAQDPTMVLVSDASLSNWFPSSARELVIGFPSSFQPHVIATDYAEPGAIMFPDHSEGIPYVVSRGAQPSRCGDGNLDMGEQCDDGNFLNGDGCSEDCYIETASCGNGTIDAGEQCDDGNTIDGDGCSSTCQAENGPSIGACCLSGGGCLEALSQSACAAAGGSYTADNLTCGQVAPECPGLLGACCLPQGGCADMFSDASCATAGGSYLGQGSSCGNEGQLCAPPLPGGACCLPDGSCIDHVDVNKCQANNGNFFGDGTSCATYGGECKAKVVGACCLGNGCAEMTVDQCAAAGGNFAGPGSHCDETTCPGCTTNDPIGACCVDAQCLMLTADACFMNGGLYAGDGSICTGETCSCGNGSDCCDEIAAGCSTTAQGSAGSAGFAMIAAALGVGLAARRRRVTAPRR
ncbi:MAG: DUF4215 domain-containing protein [Minicystis sp.]